MRVWECENEIHSHIRPNHISQSKNFFNVK